VDSVLQALRDMRWTYAEDDANVLAELEVRIAVRGRAHDLITYSDLVEDVAFDLPNLAERPHVIDTHNWQELDRALIGDFLGYISARSYEKGGFFASALVVDTAERQPGEGFYRLLKQVGLVASTRHDDNMAVWLDQVKKAHRWYETHG